MKNLLLLFMMSLSGLLLSQESSEFKFKTKVKLEMVGETITVSEGAEGYYEELIIDLRNDRLSMGKDTCSIMFADLNEDNEFKIFCEKVNQGTADEYKISLSLNLTTGGGTFVKLGENIENVKRTFVVVGTL